MKELDRIRAVSEDYVVPAHNIQFSVVDDRVVADVKLSDGNFVPPVRFEISRTAHQGLAAKFNVGQKYASRMRLHPAADLLAHNLNYWCSRDSRRFLVRTLDGTLRALLSDQYRIVDSSLLCYTTMDEIHKVNGSVIGLDFTENAFRLRGIVPDWQERIDRQKVLVRDVAGGMFDGGSDSGGIKYSPVDAHVRENGGHVNKAMRELGYQDDLITPGIVVSNSETGHGRVLVEATVFRVYCRNTAIFGERIARAHIGPKHSLHGILSRETVDAENQALWGSIRDVIKTTFDRDQFKTLVQQFGTADSLKLANPTAAVEKVVDTYDLADDVKNRIFNELISAGDATVFGLIQAVTATARDFESPDAAIALERIGGELLERAPQLVEIRR
jgi:hypothetical protein